MSSKTFASMNLVLANSDVKNSVNTFQLSKKYVKRLVKISILNIIYQRIAISEKEFEVKKYEKIPYRVFKPKSQNTFIRVYHAVTNGIIEAIDKDYLKEIVIHIVGKDNYDPLETYNIKIKYNKQDSKSNQKSSAVKAATMEYFKALTEIPGNKWQEDNVKVFFELSYNEGVPFEYEPPNFEPTKELLCSNTNSLMSLGNISTGFHKVSSWGCGANFAEVRELTPSANCSVPVSNAKNNLLEDDDNLLEDNMMEYIPEVKLKHNNGTCGENASKKRKLQVISPSCDLSTNGEIDWGNISILSSDDDTYCPCKWPLPDKYETIKCTKCFAKVHLACHGYISIEAVDKTKFSCYSCSCPRADKNKLDKLNMLMKTRAIIYGIQLEKSIPCEMQLATKDEAAYILDQLDSLGVIDCSSSSFSKINEKSLSSAILATFNFEDSQYLA
uniref:HORMA domain-containing protein n=1 Tax=Dendroctonus ponderosae TaxID=77166 RepID=A0AAR5PDF2_DENPD